MVGGKMLDLVNTDIREMISVLAILNNIRKIMKKSEDFREWGSNITRRTFYDIDEIITEYRNGSIPLGTKISCSGFLTKYSQTLLPMSYLRHVACNAKEKVVSRSIESNHIREQRELTFTTAPLQIPVHIIPSLQNTRMCFLYPENFSTFIYPINDKSDNPSERNEIIVPKEAKPIPVLISGSKHEKYIDKFVDIEARLISMPADFSKSLQALYNDVLFECSSSFFDPFGQSTFICLSLLDVEENCIAEIKRNKPAATAQVFAEVHVENLETYPDVARQIIEASIPDLISDGIKIVKFAGQEADPYLTKGDIRFVYKEPNIVGFYKQIEIFDQRLYRSSIEDFQKYSQRFSRKMQDTSLKNIGKRLKTYTDFVFDPTKAGLFDERGVLSNYNNRGNADLQDTVDWYKNAQ